jgi:hypothetical protein
VDVLDKIICISAVCNAAKNTHYVTYIEEYIQDIGGKAKRKEPLGRPRRKWVNNIEMYLRETVWDGIVWIELTLDRGQWRALVNTVMKLLVP